MTQALDQWNLEQISLRSSPDAGGDRGFVAGGSGCGKSTLVTPLLLDFSRRYRAQGGRVLILDTKPRFRAQWLLTGSSAGRLYKSWGHGQAIPGSVLVHTPADLDNAWRLGYRIAIAQGEADSDVPRLLKIAERFHRQARKGRPQLAVVDEVMDFYHANGAPRGGSNIIKRIVRAGRERGEASLIGSQRTKGIDPQIMEEMNRLYAFRLDAKADRVRYQEMGAPDFPIPEDDFLFMYWYKKDRKTVYGPLTLAPETVRAYG